MIEPMFDDPPFDVWVSVWRNFPVGELLRIRYEEGVRLRAGLTAFPAYTYTKVAAVNALLDQKTRHVTQAEEVARRRAVFGDSEIAHRMNQEGL